MVAGRQRRAGGRRMRRRPALAVLAVVVVTALSTAGCVSMPTGGPVQSFPVTQGPDAQSNAYMQIQPQPPRPGWGPQKIVQGFLTASANFGTYSQVAQQYLTPQEQKVWNHPTASAVVYKKGPYVGAPSYSGAAKSTKPATSATSAKATPTPTPTPTTPTAATVQITGVIQATLSNYSYSVPSTSTPGNPSNAPLFQLVKSGGQWRISFAPQELLLTSDAFANDYQQRNLYFFDPTGTSLVPDPIYVPVRAPGDLMNRLVRDLIKPPVDWLSGGATKTALPADTKVSVTMDGVIANVNLTGSVTKASDQVMQQIESQLYWTLTDSAQGGSARLGVGSVEVDLNGKAWLPPGSQGNPVVQRQSTTPPATGASLVTYYYVDSAGYLTSRQGTGSKSMRLKQIGTKYTQVAVSPDGRYLAALQESTLYTGPISGTLAKQGAGYTGISWDTNENLWTSLGEQIIMFRPTVSLRQPSGQPTQVPVDVISDSGIKNPAVQFTALRVAPDGVRVALVMNGSVLTFGAISGQDGQHPHIRLSQVLLTPLNAQLFTGLTWYGSDNVITLADPGPVATEYPVSGGNPTSIPAEPDMKTITASWGNLLVAGLSNGQMVADPNLIGAWTLWGTGSTPAYPG